MNREQLIERRNGIGGSDVSAILGLSKYMTPFQLYMDKIGETDIDEKQSDVAYWGIQLENSIRDHFSKKHNLEVSVPGTKSHKDHNFMKANVDGYIKEENAILEIKCSDKFMRDEWGDDGTDYIPMQYLLQVTHYCAVLDCDKAYIAVLIGGNEYREYVYNRDLDLEKKLIDIEIKFWDRVNERNAPEPTNLEDVKLKFRDSEPNDCLTTEEISEVHSKLFEIKMKKKETKVMEDELKMEVMKFMGKNEFLLNDEGFKLASWKQNKNGNRTFLVRG